MLVQANHTNDREFCELFCEPLAEFVEKSLGEDGFDDPEEVFLCMMYDSTKKSITVLFILYQGNYFSYRVEIDIDLGEGLDGLNRLFSEHIIVPQENGNFLILNDEMEEDGPASIRLVESRSILELMAAGKVITHVPISNDVNVHASLKTAFRGNPNFFVAN